MTLPTESEILAAVRKRLGREPDLVLWRLSAGIAEYETSTGQRRRAQHGLVNGASDLIGMLSITSLIVTPPGAACYLIAPRLPIARFFALEIKAPRGRLSKDQEMFLALVRKRGGFGASIGLKCATVADAVVEAEQALERARRGESQ